MGNPFTRDGSDPDENDDTKFENEGNDPSLANQGDEGNPADAPTAASDEDADAVPTDPEEFVGADPVYRNAASVQNTPFKGDDNEAYEKQAELDAQLASPAGGESQVEADADDDDDDSDDGEE